MKDEEKTREQLIAELESLRREAIEAGKAEAERRGIEAALRENEERFRLFFNSGNDSVFVHRAGAGGKPGKFIEVNEIACTRLGYTREELLNMSPLDIDAPDMAEKREAALKDLTVRGHAMFEMVHVAKDGRRIPVEINTRLFELQGSSMVISFARDITDRMQAEGALRVSEEMYRSLFDNMLNGFAYCRMLFEHGQPLDFIYLNVNDAFEALTGLKGVVGKKVTEVIPGIREVDPGLFEIYGRVAFSGTPERFEMYVESLRMWFLISVYSPHKEYFVAVFDVITERKNAEVALRESEERYKRLLESVTDYIYTVKVENGRPVSTSHGPGCLAVTGYTSEHYQMYPNLWYEMIHEEDRKAVLDQAEKLLKGEAVKPLEHRIIHKDGSIRWVRNTPVPHYDKDGRLIAYDGIIEDITKRKRAEEALRESEKRVRNIFEQASDGIFLITAENRYLDMNARGLEMLGYTREELSQMTVADVLVERERPRLAVEPAEMLAGKPHLAEWEHLRKDGSTFPAEVSARRLNDKIYIAIVRDLTERKKAEEKLRLSEERFSKAFFSSPAGMTITRIADGKFIDVNDSFLRMFEFSREEVIGHTSAELNMWTQEERKRLIQKQLESGGLRDFELQAWSKTGRIVKILFSSKSMDLEGEICHITTMIDITERKRAEEALRDSEEKLQRIINGSSAVIFVKDLNGKYLLINSLYEKLFRVSKNEIIGRTDYDIFPKEVAEALRGADKKALMANESIEAEEIVPHDDGIHYYISLKFPLYDAQGKPYAVCGIATDITERKKVEDALREKDRLLSETGRMAHVGGWEFDTETLQGTWTEEVARIHELDPNVLATAPLGLSFYHGESRQKIELAVKEAIEQGKPYDLELELVTAKGNHRCVRTIGQPIKAGNKVVKVRGSFQDITERRRAEERIKEEMEVTSHLLMISEATAHTTDIDKLMEQVVHCGHEITECDVCLSYLWDVEAKVFSPSQAFGLSHDQVPLFRTESLDMKVDFVKESMKKKEPIIIAEFGMRRTELKEEKQSAIHTLQSAFEWIPDIQTIAVIPLIGRKGPLGLIVGIYSALSISHSEFEDRDMKVMRGISHQVGVALEEAKLYRESVDKTLELSHKIETIRVMNEIDRSILSTLKAEEVLETVTRLISKVIPCDMATVSLVDMERGGLICKAGFGMSGVPKGVLIPFADTSARGIFETGRTEYVNNLSEMRQLLPLEKRFLDEGFLAHIRVPITIKGAVAGILTVGAKRVAAFTKENLSTLEYLCSQIGVALSNAGLISDLEELFISVVKSLSSAIDAKSPWTAGHSERVTKYALDIAKQMGLSGEELKELELAGLLHDVGKIGTYESILDKPAKLNDEELAVMRLHPVKGAEILAPIKQLKDIIPGVKYHHEFYDGTGYPEGLKGETIPLHARILTVADTVDAMGADRPYRKGRAMDVIIAELKRCSGTQFDPKVAEAFLKIGDNSE